MRPRRLTAIVACCLAVGGCGGADDATVTVYLAARLGSDGPPGQIAPVLAPVERERRPGMSPARQAILEMRTGPSPDERARGFLDTVDTKTRLRDARVRDGVATVGLLGDEPGLLASAAIVYAVTELKGVQRVRLQLDGRPCCFYDHDHRPIATTTRDALRGWTGEPCVLRAGDVPRCRT